MKWYDRCLGSLLDSTIPLNIIVIDNASSDKTTTYIRKNFPSVELFCSRNNLGFGQANNIGMKYAIDNNADYIFLLNQDAWIQPTTIEHLVSVHQKNKEYGILSCIHLNADKDKILQLNCICNQTVTDTAIFNDLYLGKLKEIYETKYVNAAAWLLPRSTIQIVGGFDPIFFHYGEDDNYLHRTIFHNLKIGICPHETIVHDMNLNRPLYDTRELEILTLIAYTNPNISSNVKQDTLTHLRKAITSLIRGRKTVYNKHLNKFKILKKYKKDIFRSNIQNTKKGMSWLDNLPYPSINNDR